MLVNDPLPGTDGRFCYDVDERVIQRQRSSRAGAVEPGAAEPRIIAPC